MCCSTGCSTAHRFLSSGRCSGLRAATQGGEEEFTNYDILYCAGLFDYLSQRVCKRLVDLFCTMVRPGVKS